MKITSLLNGMPLFILRLIKYAYKAKKVFRNRNTKLFCDRLKWNHSSGI